MKCQKLSETMGCDDDDFSDKKDVHDYASNDDSQGDPGREERLPDNHLGRVHFNLR